MKPSILLCTLAALPLAACTAQDRPADRPAVSPAARITGPAVSCIPISQMRETRIRDDWTIDFLSSGRHGWRNTLTARCPGLRSNDAITYETSLSQLCSTDIVYVLENIGGVPRRGAPCSIGQFVPVELER